MLTESQAQMKFQPTLPMRGATRSLRYRYHPKAISTHAPHAGSDITLWLPLEQASYFNPRSPCGERLYDRIARAGNLIISTHAPHAGSDRL